MRMALPPGIPTLQHSVSKRWSRPDNVWCSDSLLDLVLECDTLPALRSPTSDYLPIITTIAADATRITLTPTRNTRLADWEEFNDYLRNELERLPAPGPLTSKEELEAAASALTKAVQAAIAAKIPLSSIKPELKRWWTRELTELKKRVAVLNKVSHQWHGLPDHPVHAACRRLRREYRNAILTAKRTHWEDWLEHVGERDVWTANRYTVSTGSDGGSTRLPTLTHMDESGNKVKVSTNENKSELLARFSSRPCQQRVVALSPYKVPGPDGIQNIMLMRSADLLIPYLLWIYRAILDLKTYYDAWHEFLTVVLRKPGKPNYMVPKAY
ncbi:unnamed protein product [Peniophora sp. CBMAI 1063]|nr:unnamed protein product [Peniophora sp. CBMAI 1063]